MDTPPDPTSDPDLLEHPGLATAQSTPRLHRLTLLPIRLAASAVPVLLPWAGACGIVLTAMATTISMDTSVDSVAAPESDTVMARELLRTYWEGADAWPELTADSSDVQAVRMPDGQPAIGEEAGTGGTVAMVRSRHDGGDRSRLWTATLAVAAACALAAGRAVFRVTGFAIAIVTFAAGIVATALISGPATPWVCASALQLVPLSFLATWDVGRDNASGNTDRACALAVYTSTTLPMALLALPAARHVPAAVAAAGGGLALLAAVFCIALPVLSRAAARNAEPMESPSDNRGRIAA